MFLKRLLLSKDFQTILFFVITWRLALFLVLFLGIELVTLAGHNFLGGGLTNYLQNPYLFAWADFDGEHYLSIAQMGYKGLEQAFFPLYPGLIHLLSQPWGNSFISATIAGLLISNLSFVFALFFLFKLLRIDYPERTSLLTILIILIFPTSFYFGSLYGESLFLLLSVLTFFLARKRQWFWAGIFGMLASATRVFGVLLFPALILEIWQIKERTRSMSWVFLIPIGLLGYMGYQWWSVNDPFAFYHLQKVVGPQHESGITLLPTVYFRYFKILITTSYNNPIYPTIILEFLTGIIFFVLPIFGYFKKVRYSYLFFALIGFLVPSIQGSFSSVPRYIIVLFPGFLILALLIDRLPKVLRIGYFICSMLLLIIFTIMFLRGYWVA